MLYRKLPATLAVTFALASALPTSAEAAPQASDVLASYEAAIDVLGNAEYKAHVEMYVKEAAAPETLHQDMLYTVRRNAGLCKVKKEGTLFGLGSNHALRQQQKGVILLNSAGDRTIANWNADRSVRAITVDRRATEDERRPALGGEASFTFIHGYLTMTGVPYVPDVLRRARLTAKAEAVNGKDVVLLEGTGRNGRLRVWCDPATDYWPRKFEWRQIGTDIQEDHKSLSDERLREITSSVDDWDFARVARHWIPSQFTERRTITYADERVVTVKSICHFTDISIAPSHLNDPGAFELTEPIPNGTRVQVRTEPQISYTWQDGQVVKQIGVPPESLKNHGFTPGGLPKSLVALCVAAVIMVLALLVFRRWRKAQRA